MEGIDRGAPFDWSLASRSYAAWRDIYPAAFYQRLLDRGLCVRGQRVLDLGTGTGVLPRALYQYGAEFTGVDSAPGQIEQARRLAQEAGMNIGFFCSRAEEIDVPAAFFDVVTACQCFAYFDHSRLAPAVGRVLKSGGRFAVLYMAWLPEEDPVAGQSEALVRRYNPAWTGWGERRHAIEIPTVYLEDFETEYSEVFDLTVPFTRESWNGRMRSCRGIGASLPSGEADRFEAEHRALLERIAPERFEVLHYAAATVLRKR